VIQDLGVWLYEHYYTILWVLFAAVWFLKWVGEVRRRINAEGDLETYKLKYEVCLSTFKAYRKAVEGGPDAGLHKDVDVIRATDDMVRKIEEMTS
jgi:hypothetical protein